MQEVISSVEDGLRSRLEHPLKLVAGADKAGSEDRARIAVNLFGLVELFDVSLGHYRDAIRNSQGLFLVVRHIDGGHLELLLDAADLVTQGNAYFSIEGREGFIEQEYLGFDGQGTSQSDALLLATGELVLVAAALVAEADQFKQLGAAVLNHLFWFMPDTHTKGDVLFGGQMRVEGVGLEEHAHGTFAGSPVGDILAVQQNAPLAWCLEAGHHAQDGGFATSTGAKKRKKFPLLDG